MISKVCVHSEETDEFGACQLPDYNLVPESAGFSEGCVRKALQK